MEIQGELDVLNVGFGDTKITFRNDYPEDSARAKDIITKMMKMGYAILVYDEGVYRRVRGFDEQHLTYMVLEKDTAKARMEGQGKLKTKHLPVGKTKAVAVARTAGG